MKVVQALLLIVAGVGALGLLDPDSQHRLVDWLDELSLREGRRITSHFASKAIEMLGGATLERLVLIAVGCFVYASVFVVEATGLWLDKRWAEYLTIVVTASLLPFEIMEVVHKVSAPRIATLAINLAVVVYLIVRLVAERGGSATASRNTGSNGPGSST